MRKNIHGNCLSTLNYNILKLFALHMLRAVCLPVVSQMQNMKLKKKKIGLVLDSDLECCSLWPAPQCFLWKDLQLQAGEQRGCCSTWCHGLLFDLKGENKPSINSNSPSNTAIGMNWVSLSP